MYNSADAKYDPSHCQDPPAYVTLSEYDVMWGEFPGSKEVPRCMNHIKMGYDNWKRTLAQLTKSKHSKEQFLQFWSQQTRYPAKRIKQAWKEFVLESKQSPGSWAEKVFNSTALAKLAKDVACANNGHEGPERKMKDGESWDARNEYSLAGGLK